MRENCCKIEAGEGRIGYTSWNRKGAIRICGYKEWFGVKVGPVLALDDKHKAGLALRVREPKWFPGFKRAETFLFLIFLKFFLSSPHWKL